MLEIEKLREINEDVAKRVEAAMNPSVEWWSRFMVPPCLTEREGKWLTQTFMARVSIEFVKAIMDGREIHPGPYRRLLRIDGTKTTVVMSDTPAEIADHLPFIMRAKGDVLIFGLGIGMVAQALLKGYSTHTVNTVTVVEKDPDVIKLFWKTCDPVFHDSRGYDFKIVEASAYTWSTNQSYDSIWFDIWDTITYKNYSQMQRLRKRYAKNTRDTSRVMAWCEPWCRVMDTDKLAPSNLKKYALEYDAWLQERKACVEHWTEFQMREDAARG